MSKTAQMRWWRRIVLGLWLVSGIAPLFALPQRDPLPPCCRADGAHQCALRHRNTNGNPSVQAPSCCSIQQESAVGARLLALHPSRPAVRARGGVAWELPPSHSQDEAPGIAIRRASRAPPRCSV